MHRQECMSLAQNPHQAKVVVFGPQTYVFVIWICKEQTAVSHSSAEVGVVLHDFSCFSTALHTRFFFVVAEPCCTVRGFTQHSHWGHWWRHLASPGSRSAAAVVGWAMLWNSSAPVTSYHRSTPSSRLVATSMSGSSRSFLSEASSSLWTTNRQ